MEMDPRNGYDRVSSLQKRKLRDRPKKTREQERRGEERETWPLEKRRKKFEMRETVHVGFLLDFFFFNFA